MQILVAKEKHGTSYYDASTPKALAKSALRILKMRMQDWYALPVAGSFHYRSGETLTQEQIDALPTEQLRSAEQAKLNRWKSNEQAYRRYQQWYDDVIKVLDDNDTSTVTVGRNRFAREVPKAWLLLQERSDHEYEYVALEKVLQGE